MNIIAIPNRLSGREVTICVANLVEVEYYIVLVSVLIKGVLGNGPTCLDDDGHSIIEID